jgi:hypothetical protein
MSTKGSSATATPARPFTMSDVLLLEWLVAAKGGTLRAEGWSIDDTDARQSIFGLDRAQLDARLTEITTSIRQTIKEP